jgi:hypothetical protein
MSNAALDQISAEMQPLRPADLPTAQKPLEVSAGGKNFQVTELAIVPVSDALDLRVRYKAQEPLSDTTHLYQDNMAIMKALVERYPEYRDGFTAIIARALDPAGSDQDYGTLAEISKLTAPSSPTNPQP